MSRNPLGAVRRLRERASGIETDRLAIGLVGVGSLGAIAVIALGGYLPGVGSQFVGVLYPLALLFPAFGLGVLALTLWWVWNTSYVSPQPIHRGPAPERGETGPLEPVGRSTEHSLEIASMAQYRCNGTSSAYEIRTRLTENAIRIVRTRRGLDRETARERVENGTWTDDPVAAAFLSTERPLPLAEQVRNAVDPGDAYYHRVDRTISAITAVEYDNGAVTSERSGSATAITTAEELASEEVSR
ncbi:hypothetical protein C483_12783 [Natrialba hulunbeirensis JCM 10989]|uniref:Uncharacterized protein n=1 Tax=Natrialba hulunbeirensis JCM 10989 TaxID=1227493 RepID=L9ZXQ4_9EURY|nr:hypothetical protein [Natrialba hulunbeirensis]ELY90387.1 hypothetical protein C483_12783 [Natrialba hulunbeirensis JCM 10989]